MNRPATAEENMLDDIAYANLMVFGNAGFRPQQRDIVQSVLKVAPCLSRLLMGK